MPKRLVAQTMLRINFRRHWAYTASHHKSVYAASENSFFEQMSILTGMISMNQANLDAYPTPVELKV